MMKRKWIGTFEALSLAMWMAACSGPMIQTHYDHSVDFRDLHTYAWKLMAGHLQLDRGLPPDPTLAGRIRSAVDDVLQAKGFHAVPEKNADLQLDFSASAEEKVNARLDEYQTAELMGLTYTLGTLTLSMTRGTPPVVVWNGVAQANIDMSRPLEERNQKLREAVQKLLAKFPPSK